MGVWKLKKNLPNLVTITAALGLSVMEKNENMCVDLVISVLSEGEYGRVAAS